MKHSRRHCSFLLALFLAISLALPAAQATNLTPVPYDIQNHWCKTAAYPLLQRGITYTHEDGLYYPDQYITKAEAVCFLYNLIQVRAAETGSHSVWPLPYGTETHPELQGSWASPILESMAAAGILLPNIYGIYNIYSYATRSDISDMFFRANLYSYLVLPPYKVTLPSYLPDVDGLSNAVIVRDMCARGILDVVNGYVSPTCFVTWAEVSVFLVRAGQYAPMEPPEIPAAPTVGAPQILLPTYNVITVPYSSQCWPYGAWVGCEPTCLYMALQYRGAAQDITLKTFLDYLPRDTCNPARGFVGSPYVVDKSKRTTIYPAKLAEYGRNFYYNVYDFSDAAPSDIQREVLSGNPVIAYVTLWWNDPKYSAYNIDGQTQWLIQNNHAVLVTGYNNATGAYHITDPYNLHASDRNASYTYWVDGATFNKLYNVRRHAIVIR